MNEKQEWKREAGTETEMYLPKRHMERAGWRFSGLRSQMQSESKVLSSCITARGALLQPQSPLRNWDLVLSLSRTAVLNMISGPPAALSPPKKTLT